MKCEQVQHRLEALIEGDLLKKEREAVTAHLQTCTDCRRQWEQVRVMQGALRSLPTQPCPAHIVQDVLEQTRRAPSGVRDPRSLLRPLLRPAWRVAIGLVLAVTVVLVLRPLFDRAPSDRTMYAEQEVRESLEEAKWALAYVHRVMVRTQVIVQDEVIPNRVVHPIRRSVDKAIEIIEEEGGRS